MIVEHCRFHFIHVLYIWAVRCASVAPSCKAKHGKRSQKSCDRLRSVAKDIVNYGMHGPITHTRNIDIVLKTIYWSTTIDSISIYSSWSRYLRDYVIANQWSFCIYGAAELLSVQENTKHICHDRFHVVHRPVTPFTVASGRRGGA